MAFGCFHRAAVGTSSGRPRHEPCPWSEEGGNSRKRRSAADCPDRPERERKQEGWYEWRRHEVRWEERDGDDRARRKPKYKGKAVRLGAGAVAKEGDG